MKASQSSRQLCWQEKGILRDYTEIIKERLLESASVKTELARTSADLIQRIAEKAVTCFQNGGKILLCGNGGSAADSQHIAAELVGRFRMDRKPLPAIALTTDTSILLAVGNDMGIQKVFQRQVEAFGRKGDILIGLSTSGNSPNVIRAIESARAIGLFTVALVGGTSCRLAELADLTVSVPSRDTARIQESHITIGHLLCEIIEKSIFGESNEIRL